MPSPPSAQSLPPLPRTGTPLEFFSSPCWHRALSSSLLPPERAGEPALLELHELRSNEVTLFPFDDSFTRLTAPKGTHLPWSTTDERKADRWRRARGIEHEPGVGLEEEGLAAGEDRAGGRSRARAVKQGERGAAGRQRVEPSAERERSDERELPPPAEEEEASDSACDDRPGREHGGRVRRGSARSAGPDNLSAERPAKRPAARSGGLRSEEGEACADEPFAEEKEAGLGEPPAASPQALAPEDEPLSRGRPRRAAAERGAARRRASIADLLRDSADGLTSSEDERRGFRPAARRKRKPAGRSEHNDDEFCGRGGEDDQEASASAGSASDDGVPTRRRGTRGKGKREPKVKRLPSAGVENLTRTEKAAEHEEWLAIQANPPAPAWKTPAERPGFSRERELRSRRGHLVQASNRNHQAAYFDDPFDINDRGVAHIVKSQARKMQPLLQDALARRQLPPVALYTVCSGTDAPAIALELARKELAPELAAASLEFGVDHVMSCESEPFKQAYIARNFNVVIFSDVVELAMRAAEASAAGKTGAATTSFGGQREIPRPRGGHLSVLVAGTSCKDFSARKRATGVKKDIEDMGTSGETFVACIDLLFALQHDLLLLENVQGAPWKKMASYITGRVGLKEAMANFASAQKGGGSAKEKDDQTRTVLKLTKGRIVVEEVETKVGLRLGAVLRAYWTKGTGEVLLQAKALRELDLKEGQQIDLKALVRRLGLSFEGDDELIFELPVKYHARLHKVDTKLFGLPHTRNRGYLLAWKEGTFGALREAEVGDLWAELVKLQETELDHPVEAFLLPDSSDRIRRFRDVLRSPIALRLAPEQYGVDYYTTHKDADTRYNLGYRNCVHLLTQRDRARKSVRDAQKLGANMPVRARPLTRWGPERPPSLLSHIWMQDIVAYWAQHSFDHLDVVAVKNAEAGVDLLHHNVLIDLSQNVHMTDAINRPGITGCLTPGGMMFHTRRGREISGYEKLLLSGIPADQLLLGGESEVQLSDLAGNAMSMPVVSACLLAAFCIQPYAQRRAAGESGLPPPPPRATLSAEAPETNSPCSAFEPFSLAACLCPLARHAERCSVLCTCESSGEVSRHAMERCECCLLSACGMCCAMLQLETHSMRKLHPQGNRFEARDDPAAALDDFEKILRRTLPDAMRFSEADIAPGIGTQLFRLSRIERERDHFSLRYIAYSMTAAVAVIAVHIGRLGSSGHGLRAVVFDLSTGQRGPLQPAARLLACTDGPVRDVSGAWEVPQERKVVLDFEPALGDTSRSYRSEMGLIDFEAEVWANTLRVRGDASVDGTYCRQPCRGSIAFGALWKRDEPAMLPMWLFVDPDVDRTGPDRLVFSSSPTYHDGRAHHVAELLLREDQPVLEWLHELGQRAANRAGSAPTRQSDPRARKKRKGSPLDDRVVRVSARLLEWTPSRRIQLLRPKGGPAASKEKQDACTFPTFVVQGMPALTMRKLGEHSGADGSLSILAASSTLAERRLAESLASPLLRLVFETESGIATAPRVAVLGWGECQWSAPRRPLEKWVEGRRVYDAVESNEYEKRMSERPPAWLIQLRSGGKVEVRPQIEVAGHRAAEKLLRGRALESKTKVALAVEWQVGMRLDSAYELNFPISSSKGEPQAKQPPAAVWAEGLQLYPRQLAVLRWMQAIEEGDVHFDERDYCDAQLPGIGWQLQAKAGISSPLRGGVLADALGAGKTVTVIALIAADIQTARKIKLTKASPRLSRATLIVVPPLIIRQWEEEIRRFSGGKLLTRRIESAAHLQEITYQQLREADVVLIVSDLLGCEGKAAKFAKAAEEGASASSKEAAKETRRAQERLAGLSEHEKSELTHALDARRDTYLEQLTSLTGAELPPLLHRRNKNREAGGGDSETIIYGVWISASSRDPYGKTRGRQEDREAAAAFSHSYLRMALPALRARRFEDDTRGVPIEYFIWRRVIVDECHEPLCMGTDDADEAAMSSKRSSCAVRELLGIATPEVAARPLLSQRSTFGLTGTPLLSSVARITELASLCAGTYVTGASNHWRTIERASGRDLFLRYHDAVPSRLYLAQTVRSAREFVSLAARRNVVDEAIPCRTLLLPVRLGQDSRYERLCARDASSSLCPEPELIEEDKWLGLLQAAAEASERCAGLAECVRQIHQVEPLAKVLVFAPARGFDAAAEAVTALPLPTEVVRPGDGQERAAQLVLEFDEPPNEETYRRRCRVLLLSYEDGAGLNLQHGCHHVVLFAPLGLAAKNGEKVIAAVGKEQQSIGRVRRSGQQHEVVVHRLVLEGPHGERTLDGLQHERNMDEQLIRSATNTAD